MKFFLSLVFFTFLISKSFSQAPVSLEKAWSTDTIFKIPESVFYHQEKDILYVTNMNAIHDTSEDNDGFISTLSTDGKIIKLRWVEGLNDPKGMALAHGKLYVGDLKHLVEIDMESGKILKKYTAEGAQFFNDVATDKAGNVYVTDSFSNRIYRFSEGRLELWIDGSGLLKPNGIFINDKVTLVANMKEGFLFRLDKKKNLTKWADNLPSADGIATDFNGNFFVSNWNGEVYYVNAAGKSWKILDTREDKLNSADITYIKKSHLLLVPSFFGNRVNAYKVK